MARSHISKSNHQIFNEKYMGYIYIYGNISRAIIRSMSVFTILNMAVN